jgi:hypothetical protein
VPSSTSHPKEVLDEVKLFCSSASRTPSSKRLEPPRKPCTCPQHLSPKSSEDQRAPAPPLLKYEARKQEHGGQTSREGRSLTKCLLRRGDSRRAHSRLVSRPRPASRSRDATPPRRAAGDAAGLNGDDVEPVGLHDCGTHSSRSRSTPGRRSLRQQCSRGTRTRRSRARFTPGSGRARAGPRTGRGRRTRRRSRRRVKPSEPRGQAVPRREAGHAGLVRVYSCLLLSVPALRPSRCAGDHNAEGCQDEREGVEDEVRPAALIPRCG